MNILNFELQKYYDAFFYLKKILKAVDSDFIKSVYVYGSFTRNELIPDISDLDVMFFVDKYKLSKENLDTISKINEAILEEYKIHMVFRIHTIDELLSEFIAEDIFYPYLLDLLFYGICIFGESLEYKFIDVIKNKNIKQTMFETKIAFTNKKNDFLDAYLKEKKYEMADSIYDIFLLLKTYLIDPQIKIDYTIKCEKNYKDKSLDYFLNLFNMLEKHYSEIDYLKINNLFKEIKFEPGFGRGALLYNPDTKKILILEHSFGGGGWWALPKGGVEPDEINNPEKTVKREILEETGILDITLDLDKIGTTYHTFRKTPTFFRKVITEYYFATTFSKEIVVSDEHLNHKWIEFSEIKNYIQASNLKYIIYKYLAKKGKIK